MNYLMRDESTGFKEVKGEPLDRYKKPLRPFALTSDGRVVYSEWDWKLRSIDKAVFWGLKEYDKTVSQTRRREFETALARDANAHPACVKQAVDLVTAGLKTYVGNQIQEAGAAIRERCYNDSGSGRLGTVTKHQKEKIVPADAWAEAEKQLNGTDIPKILGIQNCVANFMSKTVKFDSPRQVIYNAAAQKVAPSQGHLFSWFNDDAARGRAKVVGATSTSTSAPGITSPGLVTQGGEEERKRGIDDWKRVEDSSFVKGIDLRNLAFGAGRSGTTGELLKTFRTFGSSDTGETFKQYLLAIVIYLVGGGHHTCHEIFSVANLLMGENGVANNGDGDHASAATLAKDAYVPGGYIKYLPDSYLKTGDFQILKEKYYDIVKIGHLHGTFV
jgi:hypothetical protein